MAGIDFSVSCNANSYFRDSSSVRTLDNLHISASASATTAGMAAGDRFVLMQSLADAKTGKEVEISWDVMLTDLNPSRDLILQIDRRNIGKTQVTIYNNTGSTPIEAKTFEWDQVTTNRNSYQITVPAELLTGSNP